MRTTARATSGAASASGCAVVATAARLLTVALLALPATASAAASALVEWEAPAACPGAAELFERLSASLGYEPQTLGKLSRVRGDVVPTPQGYRLSLEVDESGRRSSRWLEALSCEDLVDAAVLAITLALAPESRSSATPPPDAAAVNATAKVDGAGPPLAVTSTAPADGTAAPRDTGGAETEGAAPPVRGVASLGVVAEVGALPEPALGAAVSAGARWPAWSVAAYAALFAAQQLAARPEQYVEFELAVAGLRGCWRGLEQPLALDLCGVLEAGRWEAFGADLLSARRSRELWLAPGAGLAAELELAPGLALQLRSEAVAPLTRKRYIVNENEVVHTPGEISWRFLAGLSLSTR